MSLLFCTGFDELPDATYPDDTSGMWLANVVDLSTMFYFFNPAMFTLPGCAGRLAAGYKGGKCLKLVLSWLNQEEEEYLDTSLASDPSVWAVHESDTLIVGFHYKADSIVAYCPENGTYTSEGPRNRNIVRMIGNNQEVCLLEVFINQQGRICVYRDGSMGGVMVSDVVFVPGRWYHFELKTVGGEHGSWELRINGTTLLSETDVDMRYNDYYTCPRAIGFTSYWDQAHYYDNLYMMDGEGTAFNDFLGPTRISASRPAGDSTTNEWLRMLNYEEDVDPSDHYTYVDETQYEWGFPFPDSRLVQTDVPGAIELFTYGASVSEFDAIHGVVVTPYGWEDLDWNEEEGVSYGPGIQGVVAEDAATVASEASYFSDHGFNGEAPIFFVFPEKPGGGAWSATDFDGEAHSLAFGFQMATE
ncbi:MAG: hypothetical protein ABFC88_12820 [Thermoguttaceae bacterium]